MANTTAVLLINVGSPDSPQTKDVRRYLRSFLNNPRVIDMAKLPRWMLVNLIIAPFRAPKSAKLYKQLWTENGAPLVYYCECVRNELQKELQDIADIFVGMINGEPNIKKTLQHIKAQNYSRLLVLPLYPQYASSTTGVAIETVLSEIRKWTVIPELKIINQFYNHPLFIETFANHIKGYNTDEYDHIIFSYHGLPNRHVRKMCSSSSISECNCETGTINQSVTCYKSACYTTTRLLNNHLNLDSSKYSVGFQSRMAKNWLQPFTDKLIVAKARQGAKKILIVAPSFVTDCLETTIEIGFDYRKLFQEHGGQQLHLVESLNNSPKWIQTLKSIIIETT